MFALLSLKNWIRLGLVLAIALAVGWVVLELRSAARLAEQIETLQREKAEAEAAERFRAALAEIEAARLAAEQQDRINFGRLSDEATSDPTASAPAVSVRSVRRLNQIR